MNAGRVFALFPFPFLRLGTLGTIAHMPRFLFPLFPQTAQEVGTRYST